VGEETHQSPSQLQALTTPHTNKSRCSKAKSPPINCPTNLSSEWSLSRSIRTILASGMAAATRIPSDGGNVNDRDDVVTRNLEPNHNPNTLSAFILGFHSSPALGTDCKHNQRRNLAVHRMGWEFWEHVGKQDDRPVLEARTTRPHYPAPA